MQLLTLRNRTGNYPPVEVEPPTNGGLATFSRGNLERSMNSSWSSPPLGHPFLGQMWPNKPLKQSCANTASIRNGTVNNGA